MNSLLELTFLAEYCRTLKCSEYHHNNQEAFQESIPVFFFKIQYTKVPQLLMRLEKSKTKPNWPQRPTKHTTITTSRKNPRRLWEYLFAHMFIALNTPAWCPSRGLLRDWKKNVILKLKQSIFLLCI